MALLISTGGIDGQQDLELTIEGVSFILRFQFSERASRWSVAFLQADETPILEGRKLIPNRPLNDRYSGDLLPDGVFTAIRKNGGSEPIGASELATEVLFMFVPAAEIAAERPVEQDAFGTLLFEVAP